MLSRNGGDEMSEAGLTVGIVRTVSSGSHRVIVGVSRRLPAAVVRSRHQVEAVYAQSLLEMGTKGRAARAWRWVLSGDTQSPVTCSPRPRRPPSRDEILAEARSEPEGSTAGHGIPGDYRDQLGEARRILAWLTGESDEIPVDDDNRGRLIGARDDYARTDDDIRQVRDYARRSLEACDLPDPMDPADAMNPWHWDAGWMNAAWLRGSRDLLDWVLGERTASPLCGQVVGLPTVHDLTYEDGAAEDVVLQGHAVDLAVDPETYPPPRYGAGIQETIRWLCGEITTPPADQHGCGAYAACPDECPR
jgi:hypothetical protein